MKYYTILFFSILLEVFGTLLLPLTKKFTEILPSITLIICYGISLYLLTNLVDKLPLSVIYASWTGLGIFLVTFLNYVFYKQKLDLMTILGLFIIVLGVIMINYRKV